MKVELFYDKECPFCNSYANFIKLKDSHELIFYDARESTEQLILFRSLGFDINNGFIIKVNDKKIYQGVDAIIFLNSLARNKIYFYDNYFFRNIFYPFIKYLRKLVLKITGKKVDL